MSRRFSIIALLTAALFLCLMAGCWPFNPPTGPPKKLPTPEQLPRTSPENVLFNLRVIYGDKDNIVNTNEDAHAWAESYRTLFHPDSFKFYFLPEDYNPIYAPEGWWAANEEVTSLESILTRKAAGEIDDITLSWTVNPSEPDNRLGHVGWRHIYVTSILLDVIQGENTTRVPNGTADFYFAPDPVDSSLWVITEWDDRQPAGGSPPSRGIAESIMPTTSAPASSNWGRVKTLYR